MVGDDAKDMPRLARLSHPRVTVNMARLTTERTAPENCVGQPIRHLPPETVARSTGFVSCRTQQLGHRSRGSSDRFPCAFIYARRMALILV
jgi:hypothetical protein